MTQNWGEAIWEEERGEQEWEGTRKSENGMTMIKGHYIQA